MFDTLMLTVKTDAKVSYLSQILLMAPSQDIISTGGLFFQPVLKLMFPLLFLNVNRRPNSVKVATVTHALTPR